MNLVISNSIVRTLLSKNIPFCLYHFPAGGPVRLAVDPGCFPQIKDISFLISPFTPLSAATDVILSVVTDAGLNEDFLKKLQSFPDRGAIRVALPDETSRSEYFKEMDAYLSEIQAGHIEKAILSRVLYANKPDHFDPLECFTTLSRDYPLAFVYLLMHPQSGMWLGATPESLLKKKGSEYFTMALAGTQERNESGDYHWRVKEIEEHGMVCRHIENVFGKEGCFMIKKDGPKTIESGRVAHLRTEYTFQETERIPLKELLTRLHPTPAVGGLPVREGVNCILQHEGYDRKYYCGFLGETDFSQMADLYTNLRCMQIGEEKIAVYVGGGITAASDPQEEWKETVMKSRTMMEKIIPVKESYIG